MLFKSLLLAAALVVAAPTENIDEMVFGRALDFGRKLGLTERDASAVAAGAKEGYGIYNGWFYSFWSQCQNSVTFEHTNNNTYTSKWNNCQNWVGGKGWKPGGAKSVEYNGTWNAPNANSYLALYGWTKNPLIEYYIVDAYGTYNPGQGQRRGTVQSDGGSYDIYQSQRVNQPSIVGRATFTQFWSIRQGRRIGGKITTGNHFDAWTKSGLKLGDHDYMIMATEGYQSSGSSSITVRETGVEGAPYPNEPNSRYDNN